MRMDSAADSVEDTALGVATLAALAELVDPLAEIVGSMAEAMDTKVEVMDSTRVAVDTTGEIMATTAEADTTAIAETGRATTETGITTTEEATIIIVTTVDGGHGTTATKVGTIPTAFTPIAKTTIRTIVMEAKDTIGIATGIIARETTMGPTMGGETTEFRVCSVISAPPGGDWGQSPLPSSLSCYP